MEYSKRYIKEKIENSNIVSNIKTICEKIETSRVKKVLFSNEELVKISKIGRSAEKYLEKLQKDEFEIAIVGLEKAGKSTFANALIENAILPSAPERCTYTSTKLKFGEDKATVVFYTEEEFNEIFQNMLDELEFHENTDFRTLTEEKFNEFLEELKEKNPNLYNLHSGKSDEEIRAIIKYRDNLQLTGEVIQFSGNDLYSKHFQKYIKGEKRRREVDISKPLSVKSISIESSKLAQLQKATIFDVPGFDSTTKMHERQTIERLKNADAIILVTNAGDRPNITAPQLDTIRKESDSDGIKLSEKLFIFGNKIDTAESIEVVENNKEHLTYDVVYKYKIADEKRVFTGSALQYLVNIGVLKNSNYRNRLLIPDGIDDVREELTKYYENDRFSIMKRKVSSLKLDFEKIVENANRIRGNLKLSNDAELQRNMILRKSFKEIEARLVRNLNNLKMEIKKDILEEFYFTNRFKDDTDKSDFFQPLNTDIFDKVETEVSNSLTVESPVERINHEIREITHRQYLRDFTFLVKSMTNEKAREIDQQILSSFVDGIIGDDDVGLADEVKEESRRFVEKLTEDISHNEGRFFYLIDRFSRDLFDILLLYPVKSIERTKKFETSGEEFKFLDHYYSGGDGSLINLILTQKENKTTLNIMDILKNATRGSSKSGVIKEINSDIENLKKILKKGIIKAINLEVAFLNGIDKKMKILIDSAKKRETEDSLLFDQFLSSVVLKVKEKELRDIYRKIEDGEEAVRLLDSISTFKEIS
jgi:GTPase SAR1 family protein